MISFDEHKLAANLILLDVGEFEAILGMDWLSDWHATLDCFSKRVCFQPPGEAEFCYQGERDCVVYVSVVRAERMIRHGCEAYLAFVLTETSDSELRVEDVPVVREFSDMFSEELPELLPDQEIEFAIEV